MKRWIALITITLFMVTAFGCGGTQVSSASSPVNISIARLNKTATGSVLSTESDTVVNIVFTISAPDMTTITDTIPVAGQDTISASFSVPNGSNRHFLAVAYAADNSVLYQGDAYSDLNGTPTNIDIMMGVDVSGSWTITFVGQSGSQNNTVFVTFTQVGNSLTLVGTGANGNTLSGTGTVSGNAIQTSVIGSECGGTFNVASTGTFFADGTLGGTFTKTGGCNNDSGGWSAVRGQSLPLAVQPNAQTIAGGSGGTASFTISGGTAPYTVSSNNPSFEPSPATVTANGGSFASTVPAGTSAVTVTYTITDSAGATAAATLNITAASLASIAVTPANPSIAVGATQQFTATGTYSDATTKDLTTQVSWTSSQTAVATVNSGGLATAVSAGATTIAATLGNVSGNTTLTAAPSSLPSGFPSNVPTGNYSISVQVCVQGTCFGGQSFTESNLDINQFAQNLVNALNTVAAQQEASCSQNGVSCSFNIVYTPWNGTSFTITDNITVTSANGTESASIVFTVTKV